MYLGDYTHALDDCNSALHLDELYDKARLRRARVYRGKNDFDKSVKDYQDYLHNLKSSNTTHASKEMKEIEKELNELIQQERCQKSSPKSPFQSQSHSRSTKYSDGSKFWDDFCSGEGSVNSSYRSKQNMHNNKEQVRYILFGLIC